MNTSHKHSKMYLSASSIHPFLVYGWSLQDAWGLLAALLLAGFLSTVRDCLIHFLHTEERLVGRRRQFAMGSMSTRIGRATVHLLSTALVYILMLCLMTYNLWLLLVVSLGAGLSHLLLRPWLDWSYLHSVLSATGEPELSPLPASTPAHELCHLNGTVEAGDSSDNVSEKPRRTSFSNPEVQISEKEIDE